MNPQATLSSLPTANIPYVLPAGFMPPTAPSDASSESSVDSMLGMSEEEIKQHLASLPAFFSMCLDLKSEVDSLKTKCCSLENECHELKADKSLLVESLNNVKKEFSDYKSATGIRFNTGEQYSRSNNLVFEKLRNVPTNLHGMKFTKRIVNELNRLFPDIKLSSGDIDTSHILYFKVPQHRRDPVVIVKFVNRDLRNLIYSQRLQSTCREVLISEHLTPLNKELFKKTADVVGESNVRFSKRMVFANINGQQKNIQQASDIPDASEVVSDHTPVSNDVPPVPAADVRRPPPKHGKFQRRRHQNHRPPPSHSDKRVFRHPHYRPHPKSRYNAQFQASHSVRNNHTSLQNNLPNQFQQPFNCNSNVADYASNSTRLGWNNPNTNVTANRVNVTANHPNPNSNYVHNTGPGWVWNGPSPPSQPNMAYCNNVFSSNGTGFNPNLPGFNCGPRWPSTHQ